MSRWSCFARADGRLFGTVDQFDDDFGDFWEAQNRIKSPVKAGYPCAIECHFFFERAADRLDDIALIWFLRPSGLTIKPQLSGGLGQRNPTLPMTAMHSRVREQMCDVLTVSPSRC